MLQRHPETIQYLIRQVVPPSLHKETRKKTSLVLSAKGNLSQIKLGLSELPALLPMLKDKGVYRKIVMGKERGEQN